jgi:hypothetical protein
MKTAMQELIDYFNERPEYDKTSEGYEIIEKSKQLLEKEKEQIKKAYKDYHDLGHIFGLDTEQYFNQTYNQNK